MHHLLANLVSSVGVGLHFDFLDSQSDDPPSFGSMDVKNMINCISPPPFSRSVINKGLLHSDFLVKNGTLRLLLEGLKLLDSFFRSLNLSCSRKQKNLHRWASLKQEIQNEIRTLLPDPQVLLTLLSSLGSHARTDEKCLKRKTDEENFAEQGGKKIKKLKTDAVDDEMDIIVAGISAAPDIPLPVEGKPVEEAPEEPDSGKDFINVISQLWCSDMCSEPVITLKDAEIFFHSKLLDALKIYLLTMPTALEGSFDFFMNLLSNPLALPNNLQGSLLSLLVEYIKWSPTSGIVTRTPSLMYKQLQTFINLLIFSPTGDIKVQAYNLAWAAMSSTGAFDQNLQEIDAWFFFLPGYTAVRSSFEVQGIEVLQSLSSVVISFLCDAISTIGNNLFKYWDALRNYNHSLKEFKDGSLDFSPFIICILQKCARLLSSESGTFSLPEKSIISVYVCSTLKYLLQTQVDAGLFSALIRSVLSEGIMNHCPLIDDSESFFCEWRPLRNLMLSAESILNKQACCQIFIDQEAIPTVGSLTKTLDEVRNIIERGHGGEIAGISKALFSSIICVTSNELLKNFPSVLITFQRLRVPESFLSSILFLDQSFLAGVLKLWPEVFFSGLEMVISMINSQGTIGDVSAKEIAQHVDFDVSESAKAVSFSLFLRQVPFHVLFPAIMSINAPSLLESSNIKDLLLARLSESASDSVISHLRLILFWFHQIRSSYRIKPLTELEQLAEICYALVKHILAQPLASKLNSPMNAGVPLSANYIGEVAETIFCHPAVVTSLVHPLHCHGDFTERKFEEILCFSRQMVHKIDHHVLDMLTASFDELFLLSGAHHHSTLEFDGCASKVIVKAFNSLLQRLYMEFRDKFDQCTSTEDPLPLLPSFYALHALIRFISPFELLKLVHWMFGRVDVSGLNVQKHFKLSALSVGLCIAADAFDMLSAYLQQPMTSNVPFYMLWKSEEKTFDVNLIEEIYVQACKFATDFNQDFAHVCLLKAVNAVCSQKYMKHGILHPLSLVLPRIIRSAPLEILSQCVYQTSMTKAKLLSVLVEMSPLHLSVFGHLFFGLLDEDSNLKLKTVDETRDLALSNTDFVMLLPAALSYLNSILMKFEKQQYKQFTNISLFYSKLLLQGFCHWKSFVSGYVFQESYNEFLPSSIEELLNLVDSSLLGKAICMLRQYFDISGDMKLKERLKLFNSVLSCSDTHVELLDCEVGEMEFCSCNQSLNLVNRVVAKISFCRMLLFPKDNQTVSLQKEAVENLKEAILEKVSNKERQSRMRLLKILADTWQFMVKKFPSVSNGSTKEKISNCLQLYRYLELFIFRTIFELAMEMREDLILLESVPFLEQLMRSSLLYRFEDPTTLKILRGILVLLSEGKLSCALYLQLLVSHSQFSSTIQSITKSFGCQTGAFVKPMSSILRSFVILRTEISDDLQTELHMKQLEIVKLLRTLLQLKLRQSGFDSGNDIGINLKELHLLLLSSYGATLSETDLEIYNLMLEIESIDNSVGDVVADMDYLWGTAALKISKERVLDQETYDVVTNTEAVKEHRRSQFRENLPVDPKMCVTTVLHFPYDRTVTDGSLSLDRLQLDNLRDIYKIHVPGVENIQLYDPVFILRFAFHALSMGYIEAVEFAGLGLLAVAFVSMSSPDVGMRKLGYELIGKYKNVLENCQKTKDVMRLRLLLSYLQNGISESWQRIPSVLALFAAELSLILLDPSHDHYTTLSKHLMHSSKVNMKNIPLFHAFFLSNSVNFRMERLWMLRLARGGLNLDDDSQMFVRNSTIETLMSFYSSPLSDNESKEIILEIVKKAAKLPRMVRYLVEHGGLFPWLSSALSVYKGILHENERKFFSQLLVVVIEVVNDVVSSRNIVEWLQNYALEQLMELATYLYKLLVAGLKLMKENVTLVNSALHIMLTTLKISQKRKIYQPHFTLTFEGLFQIYQALDVFNTAGPSASSELGLKTILMGFPRVDIFHMNQEKLSSFLLWAVSTAMKSNSSQIINVKDSHANLTINLEETPSEESLISKLLRWLVASVILGKLPGKPNDVNDELSEKSSFKTLFCWLTYFEKRCGESNELGFDCEEVLASSIFYLQQLLGVNFTALPSVVSSLYLLLCKSSKFSVATEGYTYSLCTKIRCPPEANPAWRWSFCQQWKDLSCEPSESQRMNEQHACQSLLVVISKILGKKSSDDPRVSLKDVHNSGLYEWERIIAELKL
ncbi:NUCLEOLAR PRERIBOSOMAL-ASSOCIATED PROTEIN 1 [Salix purpurea]|uniref:NUCLEOLAR PRERIBOSOMAL-ASSOCIATED PROTEIN 1 n=1 Tax=Salix purpurea TaxID=77065 RepID=A0A9Q1A0M6_SALPP|nr:NUCLEOLAR PRERIBOSOMAL-ASSOCIATED PROTEIN 1 [Salix purpurea]